MTDVWRVRPAVPGDRDQIWPLVCQFATSFEPERDVFDDSFDALIARGDTLLAVAELSTGVIVGYALTSSHLALFANGSVAWVEELMVEPDRRRRGVGAALMQEAEEWARGQGAAYVALATRRAADFYRAIGYRESATYFRKSVARPS